MTLAVPRQRAAAARIPLILVVPVAATLTTALALARRQPLSWDEAVTVAVATRPVTAIVGTVQHSDAVLGPYYLLMHGWGAVVATLGVRLTETWWRLPSAAAAIATCVVVASCARRTAGPVAGVSAGCLLAVLPLFGFYAADARPYTLAALAVTVAWRVWAGATVRHPLHRATLTVTLLVCAGWLQLFTVLVWPAFVLVEGRAAARRSLAVLGVATLGVLPVVGVALTQSSEIGWIPSATLGNTGRVALHVAGGIAVLASVGLLVVLAVRRGPPRRSPMTSAVLWWVLAPFVVLAALDVVRPVLVARYALVSLPLAAVAFGVVVARAAPGRGGRAVRAAALVVVVAAVTTSAWQNTRPWKYEDYRGAATFAAKTVEPGTPVLFAPSSTRLGFDLYAPTSYLRDLALPGGVGADPLRIAESPVSLVREGVAASCTVVLVGDPSTTTSRAHTGVDQAKVDAVSGWAVAVTRRFGQVSVSVVENPACAPAAPATARK